MPAVNPPDTVVHARTLRAEGLTYREIGDRLGVSVVTAWRWCRRPDVRRKDAPLEEPAPRCNVYPDYMIINIVLDRERFGMTQAGLSKKYGVSTKVVRGILRDPDSYLRRNANRRD